MPRPRTGEFDAALSLARHDPNAPQPLCVGRWEEFTEYDEEHTPTEEQAAEMCDGCPLLDICRQSAKKERPEWGVQGGIAWAWGRQANLHRDREPMD